MSNVAVPAAPQSRSSNGVQTGQSLQSQKTGHQRINKVAVLGAGTMGARIAAHFANAGVPCVLLDIVTPDAAQSTAKAARRKLVAGGLEAAVKSKPAAFFEKGLERLITIGTLFNMIARSEFETCLPPRITPVAYDIGQRCRIERLADLANHREVDVAELLLSRNRTRNAAKRAAEWAALVDDENDWANNFRAHHLGEKLISLALRFAVFEGKPIFVWAGSFAQNSVYMAASSTIFAINWGAFYAVVNWLKRPESADEARRLRVHIMGGLLWAGAAAQIAVFADGAGPAREPILMAALAAGVVCTFFTSW